MESIEHVTTEIYRLVDLLFKSEFDDILDDDGEIQCSLGEHLTNNFPGRIDVQYDEKVVVTENDDIIAEWQFKEAPFERGYALYHQEGLFQFVLDKCGIEEFPK